MNIMMVTPYPDLYQTASEVISDLAADVILTEGDQHTGLKNAREIIKKNNIEIIISRGGTAALLRNNLNITVLEINVTGYDLLRALYPHIRRYTKIAVVGYDNIISGARSISEILNTDLGIFTISDDNKVDNAIEKAVEWGAELVIGDVISTEIARKKGIKTELILSGREAIEDSLREAFQIQREMIIKTTNIKRLNSIVEHSDNGIIYIDSEGRIIQVNASALSALQKNKEQLLGCAVGRSCLPDSIRDLVLLENKGEEKNGIVKIGAKTLFIDIFRIIVNNKTEGCIVYIHDTGKIQYLETLIRKELSSKGLKANYTFEQMTFQDPKNYGMINKAKQYSLTDSTILLYGETGTGKELFAQSIHNNSQRKNGPFVAINCAALPDTLLESELFGYAEGAFTGALKGGKKGLFELAHMGTFFLDEIGEMNLALQSRLLRVLQEKEIMVLGDNKVVHVDVRIIAASNRNLYDEVTAGRFRSDLYYRIKVLDIYILPLRERVLDIIPLFIVFVEHYSSVYGYKPPQLDGILVENLTDYSWPGNIRELRNFAEKFTILSSIYQSPEEISRELFKDSIQKGSMEKLSDIKEEVKAESVSLKSLKEMEHSFIISVLEQTGWNISRAAEILGIERVTLRKKIKGSVQAAAAE